MEDKIIDAGSAVMEVAFLIEFELDLAKERGTSWYRSKDKKGGDSPFATYMMNKKWTLEEEFNNHMLRFHQVTLSFIFQ